MRAFNQSLGEVSTLLAGERDELAASLGNLGVALEQVGGFVEENKASLGRNIKGLNRVAKVLVKQRAALDEVLRYGPLALNNLALTYNPDAGTLDTNANIGNLAHELTTNPGLVLCAVSDAVDKNGKLCDLFSQLDGSQGQEPRRAVRCRQRTPSDECASTPRSTGWWRHEALPQGRARCSPSCSARSC